MCVCLALVTFCNQRIPHLSLTLNGIYMDFIPPFMGTDVFHKHCQW